MMTNNRSQRRLSHSLIQHVPGQSLPIAEQRRICFLIGQNHPCPVLNWMGECVASD